MNASPALPDTPGGRSQGDAKLFGECSSRHGITYSIWPSNAVNNPVGRNLRVPMFVTRRKLGSKTSEKSSLIFSGFQWFLIFQKQSALGPPRASNSGRKLKYLKGLEPASPLAFPLRKSVHVRGFCPERIKRRQGPPGGSTLRADPPKSVHYRSGLTLRRTGRLVSRNGEGA